MKTLKLFIYLLFLNVFLIFVESKSSELGTVKNASGTLKKFLKNINKEVDSKYIFEGDCTKQLKNLCSDFFELKPSSICNKAGCHDCNKKQEQICKYMNNLSGINKEKGGGHSIGICTSSGPVNGIICRL